MQQVRNLRSPLLALAITGGLLAIWLVPPASTWFHAFVKLEPMRTPYTIVFFSALWLSSTLVASRLRRWTVITAASIGAATGYLIALLSLIVANLFIPDGVSRTLHTIDHQGLLQVLATDAVVSFVLGGWLMGAAAFAVLHALSRPKPEQGQ